MDQIDYLDSDTLAHGIKRRLSSEEPESDIMASDELGLGVATVEVVAGTEEGTKKIKVKYSQFFKTILLVGGAFSFLENWTSSIGLHHFS